MSAKLNILAFSRRDKDLASCIQAHTGNILVGMDLTAGEPTVTAHYSKDPAYRFATLDGVGKAPYWDDNGTLMLDDIYLMVMSRSPLGAAKMKALWNQSWPAGDFATQWVTKPKVIKSAVEDDRQLHKMICLALGYGLGADKMQRQVYEQFSKNLSIEQCKEFKRVYWQIFAELDSFVKRCTHVAKRTGYIINDFGYRVTLNNSGVRPFDNTHKAFNYLIQSSVSGIMHVLIKLIDEECRNEGFFIGDLGNDFSDSMRLITVIHDELVYEVNEDAIDRFETCKKQAVIRLNEYLNWSVPVRVGFSPGKTFYDIKG